MLVVIPTYRRNDCLRWVCESLAQCSTASIAESVRVLVVSNYPPAYGEVKAIVRPFIGTGGMEWALFRRDQTLDPVDNWYSAIRDYARVGEVVLLHGDDDLFLPWSLEDRWRMLTEANADLLLTPFVSRVYFEGNQGEVAYFPGCLPTRTASVSWEPWDYMMSGAPDPVFIGAQAYRWGPVLSRALEDARHACHSQHWVDRRNQELMLPFYLPFFLKQIQGSVIMSGVPCTLRGGSVHEARTAPFGVPGWNSCFVDMLALALFRSGAMGDYSKYENYAAKRFARIYADIPTVLTDRRIPFRMALDALSASGISLTAALRPITARAWCICLADRLGLTGRRLARRARMKGIPTTTLLRQIRTLNGQSL